MSELKYDPELPFVVRIRFSEELLGRFSDLQDAEQIAGSVYGGYDTEVIDTTPKPKIPEGADYLIWEFEGETQMSYRDGNDWYGSGEWWPTEELVEALKDAEVTVLVRKEDS